MTGKSKGPVMVLIYTAPNGTLGTIANTCGHVKRLLGDLDQFDKLFILR